MGLERFARDAADAGVDGVLALDLPIEEAGGFRDTLAAAGLDTIFLLSPTTTDARIAEGGRARAADSCTGFRGSASPARATAWRRAPRRWCARIRAHTTLPIALGFGISRPEHVAEVCGYADAAVVGSALVSVIAEAERLAGSVATCRSVRALAEGRACQPQDGRRCGYSYDDS